MIELKTNRQDLETVRKHFFPFIELLQQTRLNNVAHVSTQSDEYLNCLAINCITDEIFEAVDKKLLKGSADTLKLKLSEAQAIVFFRLLILLPIPPAEFYMQKLRTDLIEQLDSELITQAIYKQGVHNPENVSDFLDQDFDDY